MADSDSSQADQHKNVRGLASREDAAALQELTKWAANGDQFLRRSAIETIGRHPQGRELQAVVLGAFGDSSEYVIRTVCDVVAQWQLLEAHDPVVRLLKNTSVATRKAAVSTLGAIWSDADFETVFRVYKHDNETVVRREAAWVLRRRVTHDRWQVLFDSFCADELARHRKWACELAETFSGAEVLSRLSELSLDGDGHVRKAAVKATQAISTRR